MRVEVVVVDFARDSGRVEVSEGKSIGVGLGGVGAHLGALRMVNACHVMASALK
jgi:hypothetical protein